MNGLLLEETDENGNSQIIYINHNQISKAVILKANGRYNASNEDIILSIITDHLGTPRLALDNNQTIVWQWQSYAFGDGHANEDPDGDGKFITLNLRFSGQYYDEESRLHYNWNRYYDPELGRYITSDPIGLQGGLNTYVYTGNRPTKFTDSTGLKWECKWVVHRYYDKVIPELVQPEMGRHIEICIPIPSPTIAAPDPRTPRDTYGRPNRIPNPLDFNFELSCYKEWFVTQKEVWEYKIEKWVSGYMQCTDTCTGEVKNHWASDRPVSEEPDLK